MVPEGGFAGGSPDRARSRSLWRLKRLGQKFVAAVGLIGIAYTSFALMLAPATASESHQYSSREVFEGVFFGVGPVAAAVPQIWQLPPKDGTPLRNDKVASAVALTESKIERVDVSYFEQFGKAMTSGDPGLVSAQLDRTKRDLQRAGEFEASRGGAKYDVAFKFIDIVLDETFVTAKTPSASQYSATDYRGNRPLVHSELSGFSRDKFVALLTSDLQSL